MKGNYLQTELQPACFFNDALFFAGILLLRQCKGNQA